MVRLRHYWLRLTALLTQKVSMATLWTIGTVHLLRSQTQLFGFAFMFDRSHLIKDYRNYLSSSTPKDPLAYGKWPNANPLASPLGSLQRPQKQHETYECSCLLDESNKSATLSGNLLGQTAISSRGESRSPKLPIWSLICALSVAFTPHWVVLRLLRRFKIYRSCQNHFIHYRTGNSIWPHASRG